MHIMLHGGRLSTSFSFPFSVNYGTTCLMTRRRIQPAVNFHWGSPRSTVCWRARAHTQGGGQADGYDDEMHKGGEERTGKRLSEVKFQIHLSAKRALPAHHYQSSTCAPTAMCQTFMACLFPLSRSSTFSVLPAYLRLYDYSFSVLPIIIIRPVSFSLYAWNTWSIGTLPM